MFMENELPSGEIMLRQPEWARLTLEQLKKDADLSGIEWPEVPLPADYETWIGHIQEQLQAMDKQNPELLSRFLYRVDLPEHRFLENPFPDREMAEAVLRREFMKIWFKAKYKP